MYIFYGFCLLFLPSITRTNQLLRKKQETSLLNFLYIIGAFTIIFGPLLALGVLNYHNVVGLDWSYFAITIVSIFGLLAFNTYKYLKQNSLKEYLQLLKYLILTECLPFFICLFFMLTMMFIKFRFVDQFAYTNVSGYFKHGMESFSGDGQLAIYYKMVPGYYVNIGFCPNNVIGMYNFLWTILPVWAVLYGCNDMLLYLFKNKKYGRYYLFTSALLLGILILGYGIFWSYGAGNTLLQGLCIFILIYLFLNKKKISGFFITSLFLFYFSCTGVLLSVGLLIVLGLYLLFFKPVKAYLYWPAYLFLILGPTLVIIGMHRFDYIVLFCVALVMSLIAFFAIQHISWKWFDWSFPKVYANYNTNPGKMKLPSLKWIFHSTFLYYILISIFLFCAILLCALYFTVYNSKFIFSALNILSLIGNLIICVVMGIQLIKWNKFNQVTFLLFFLCIACTIASIIVYSDFTYNHSIWRITYLSIGFNVPVYYLALFGITSYPWFISYVHFKDIKKMIKNQQENHVSHLAHFKKYFVNISAKTVWLGFTTFVFIGSSIYIGISCEGYLLSTSPNVQINKTFFNDQEDMQLAKLKTMMTINTKFLSDSPINAVTNIGQNLDDIFTFDPNEANPLSEGTYQALQTASATSINALTKSISTWAVSMYGDYKTAIWQYANNYYTTNKSDMDQQLASLYNYKLESNNGGVWNDNNNFSNIGLIHNYMANTFYGKDYVNNFVKLVNEANSHQYTTLQYLVFNSDSSLFSQYQQDHLFSDLINELGYKLILNNNVNVNNTTYNINHDEPYLYILELK